MSNDLEKLLREFREGNQWSGAGEALLLREEEEERNRESLASNLHVMPADYPNDHGKDKIGSKDILQGLGKKQLRKSKILLFVILLLVIWLIDK